MREPEISSVDPAGAKLQFGRALSFLREGLARDFRSGARTLALGGIATAVLLALWSSSIVQTAAPTVREITVSSEQPVVTGLYWFGDSQSLAIGLNGMQSIAAKRDGELDGKRAPPQLITKFAQISAREDLRPAVQALSGLPGSNGEFLTRVQPNEVLAPGGLVAIDRNGYLLVPGSTVTRGSGDASNRGIMVQPEAGAIWQIGQRRSGEARALRISGEGAPVSAITFMSHANLVAVGALDGSLRLISTLEPALVTGNEPVADDLTAAALRARVAAHDHPIVALEAASAPTLPIDGADLVSLASDGALKAWRLNPDQRLASLDLALPEAAPEAFYVPGGLELSPNGETIALRTANGALYVARLVDDLRASLASGGGEATPQPPQTQQGPVSVAAAQSRRRAYHVQIIIRTGDQLDVAGRQAALERLRGAMRLVPGTVTAFDEAALQRASDAIAKRQELALLAPRTVDEQTAQALRTIGSPLLSILPSPILLRDVGLPVASTATAFSLDGRRLFAAGTDCQIREVDLEPLLSTADQNARAKVLMTMPGHGALLTHLALSPDGELLAASSIDRRVRIHRLAEARTLAVIPLADLATGPPCQAQSAADTQVAKNLAQAQVVTGAISQIQRLVSSMSRSCPGGASGVPPVSWTVLQSYGDNALSALNDAKLALARGQNSYAVERINSAQAQLDALVNGLHNNCSGGASGVDPAGYSAFTSTKAAVKGSLDGLKRSLGG
ncbi:WD40 repeat domain-containing protein [Bradyrhizobium diazoefficiens]|uniref:WD40 repeat domain-containing protein n=1 Tax=Bradyrhizobium diazoefficiens TaxID=1355477 RepID=UPI003482CF74